MGLAHVRQSADPAGMHSAAVQQALALLPRNSVDELDRHLKPVCHVRGNRPADEFRVLCLAGRELQYSSAHCTGVGAAQDLAELDINLAAITRADGWKSKRK